MRSDIKWLLQSAIYYNVSKLIWWRILLKVMLLCLSVFLFFSIYYGAIFIGENRILLVLVVSFLVVIMHKVLLVVKAIDGLSGRKRQSLRKVVKIHFVVFLLIYGVVVFFTTQVNPLVWRCWGTVKLLFWLLNIYIAIIRIMLVKKYDFLS